MKKLMIAVAIVCAAAMSQASQFSWGFTYDGITTHEGGENYLDGGTALLYLGTVSFANGAWDTTGATLLATDGQNPSTYKFGYLKLDANSPANDGVIGAGGQAYTLILCEDSGVTDIASYVGDGKSYYLETGTSGTGSYMSGTTSIPVATMKSSTEVGGAMWSEAAAVPEPTSGLLLLLGMAGLALKRKRA